MSTYLQKAESVERKWYVIDAAGKPLGRVATVAADLLRGKNKVTYTPNVDCGDHVVIINCDKAVLTGKKLEQKFHYHHTGWIGGMKSVNYKTLMAHNSDKAMMLAVKGMIPSNTIGAKALTRLRVYKGAEHKNAAQKPEIIEL
ncbi:MAG: 50S ribosomal protein L13 [Oscillospiraceae bacterium]|nr:50S ribosomal protein L13 [Oscillospiraceae bacterium]